MANRDSPLTDLSGAVTIVENGNIVISQNSMKNIVLSSNPSTTSNNPILQLLSTGNLVVKDIGSDDISNNYIWQSFDYPCDTLIPGMKLGWDLTTGQNWFLTSWKSLQDPSAGLYTYKLDIKGLPQVHLRRGSDIVYRSGPWDGVMWDGLRLGGGLQMKGFQIFKSIFIYNSNYIYFSFDNSDNNMISRFLVDSSGVLNYFTWNQKSNEWFLMFSLQKDLCDAYSRCGPNGICNENQVPICHCPTGFVPKVTEEWYSLDWSSGCVPRKPLNCSTNEGFMRFPNLKLPDNSYAMQSITANQENCADACLRNCSCVAYATTELIDCVMWFGDLLDVSEFNDGGDELYVRMAASELESSAMDKVTLIIFWASTILAVLLLVLVALYVLWKRKSGRKIGQSVEEACHDDKPGLEDLELPLFDRSTIAAATNDFAFANKVGEGGFGPVYKGKLSTGQEIAVKVLSKDSGQGLKEFKNEVILIAKLQHRNLVRLLGCYIHAEEQMLVYEYMSKRSLDLYIFDSQEGASLDWQKRFNIVVGIARGLLYLHRDSRLRIIHRDLKASNILLDSDLNPKISDFGLARMFGGDQTEAKTCRVMGTYGYMSPEYAIDGQFSVKSDVFSFGVLLLEIVSGKRNREFYHPDHDFNLLGHAWILWNDERAIELLMDPFMENPINTSEVLKCIQVGLLCVQQCPEDRPTMSSVVLMLDCENPLLPQPRKPGYYTDRCLLSNMESYFSGNDLSITTLMGR